MTYDDCLLVPGLVTNLIGTKTVTQARGKLTFKDELVTVQDHHGCTIGVPISSNGYLAAGMILWDDSMPKPKVLLAFAGTRQKNTQSYRDNAKANLWHHHLGHPGYKAILHTQSATMAHNIYLQCEQHSLKHFATPVYTARQQPRQCHTPATSGTHLSSYPWTLWDCCM
ncbi:uncharacterized protein UBRO_20740 [Ustilago bromivora]|uniref:GAG-pre-integrase domain-containing protein n=1 Tax=Ustilago bromivora TaxID=307758 RepID=A0A1K0H9C1_9BASI|nr:uncharacterized protein UBRO_20740 [Ustilago bromivora]